MTVTSPSTALKGSRQFMLSYSFHASVTAGADITRYFVGNATSGLPLGRPWRATKLMAWINVTNASAEPMTITVYKGSVAAGNRALELTPDITAIAEVESSTETVVNAGLDVFSATEKLIIRLFFDFTADNVIFESMNVTLFGEWAD